MPVLVNELVIMLRGNIYCNIYSVIINLISFTEKNIKDVHILDNRNVVIIWLYGKYIFDSKKRYSFLDL